MFDFDESFHDDVQIEFDREESEATPEESDQMFRDEFESDVDSDAPSD